MRAFLLLTALTSAAPAYAQAVDTPTGPTYYWTATPTAGIFPYVGLGNMAGRDCTAAIQSASMPLFQDWVNRSRAAGTTVPGDINVLAVHLRVKSMIGAPFAEAAITDRTYALKARELCGGDPRAAGLTPAALRTTLGAFVTPARGRATICESMRTGTANMLQLSYTNLKNRIATNNVAPIDINTAWRAADAATEVAGDLAALCPATKHDDLTKQAGQFRSGLEPMVGQLFGQPQFRDLFASFMNNAIAATKAANTPGATDAAIAAECGGVVFTHQTLTRANAFALPAYRAAKATPREKAAFAIHEACWKGAAAVRAAAKGFPAGPGYTRSDD